MRIQDQLSQGILSSFAMLERTLADFTDADMLVRPVPGANHASWQVGHLICSDTRLVEALRPGALPPLPAGFTDLFTRESAATATGLPSKQELLDLYRKQRQAMAALAQSLTDAELDTPTPERLQRLASCLGGLLFFLPTHLSMHLGQMQVTRRALGKPVLI